MDFSERLKEEMISHDVKPKELSAKTKISVSTIRSYLKKENSLPNIESAYRISQALDISLDMLVTGHEFYHHQETISSPKDIHKYDKVITALDSMTDSHRQLAINIVELIKRLKS